MESHRFLRRKAASKYLHEVHGVDRAPSTLAKDAVIGGGPVFQRLGRVPVYTPVNLDEWVASKLSGPMHSTSGAVVAGARGEAKTGGMGGPRATSREQGTHSHPLSRSTGAVT